MSGTIPRGARAIDPVQDVERHIERRRGVRSQRELQRDVEQTRRGNGPRLRVGDDDSVLADDVTDIRFTGSGASVETNGGRVTVTVTGGSGGTITVQEGDVTVDSAAGTLDFDASDFNVTSSPSGEANIALNYGTGAGQPAEGDHNHDADYAAIVHSHALTVALDDLSDVAITSLAEGEVLLHNGTSVVDAMHVSITLGPFYIDDVPGTATTQATLGYFNTATAVSRAGNDPKMARSGRVIGAIITASNARTAGTATVRVRINGTGTAFDSGSVVLDGTNTLSDSAFVGYVNGVAFSAGDTVGAELVTSGWTPTTGNVSIWLVLQLAAYTG